MCVGSVCIHPSYNDKNPPTGFYFLITFILKGMRQSPICLNASMFARIIRDPALSTQSLQITFPNNVLVSQFRGRSLVCSIDIISRCLIMDCFYPAGTRRLGNVRLTLDMMSDRRCILIENENRVDINIWRQFDVDLTLDFGYTT